MKVRHHLGLAGDVRRGRVEQHPCRVRYRRPPGTAHDRELLFHEQAVGDHSLCTTGTQEPGECGQQMDAEYEKILHWRSRVGKIAFGNKPVQALIFG